MCKIWTKRGVTKKLLRNRGLAEMRVLLERGFSNCFISFSSEKHAFISIGILFFCLVNIHASCNQQIYSSMWFTFYQKRIENFFSLFSYFQIKFCEIFIISDVYFHFHIICTPPFFCWGGELNLTGPQLLEWVGGKVGGDFFRGLQLLHKR